MFNHTYMTNATVVSSTELYCDTPPLNYEDEFGEEYIVKDFYNVSVSADGEAFSNASINFYYYDQPVITAVEPWVGPMEGKTEVTLKGKQFN